MTDRFCIRDRVRSFGFALQGMRELLVVEHNARLHLLATVLVVVAGTVLALPGRDWALLVLAMGLVWMAESLNSAVEALADAAVPDHHPLIRRAKDVAAAGVLFAALAALVVGVLVFAPYLLQ